MGNKDGTLHSCIVFCGLNNITTKTKILYLSSSQPLKPSMRPPASASWTWEISTMIRIREGDVWKTAFNVPLGHFEYFVMPFGLLTSALVVFQALHLHIPEWHSHLLIHSLWTHHPHSPGSPKVHGEQTIHQSWKMWIPHQLCQLPGRHYWENIWAVTKWPKPTILKQLQRFLGIKHFYCQFIKDYHYVAAPLTTLTTSTSPFVWTTEAKHAFVNLKKHLSPCINPTWYLLSIHCWGQLFGLWSRAVLSQHSAPNQKLYTCAFISHFLCQFPDALNYYMESRELIAVKQAQKEWAIWIGFILWPMGYGVYVHPCKLIYCFGENVLCCQKSFIYSYKGIDWVVIDRSWITTCFRVSVVLFEVLMF